MKSKNEILATRASVSNSKQLHDLSVFSMNGRDDRQTSVNVSLSSRERSFAQRSLNIDTRATTGVMDRRAKMQER